MNPEKILAIDIGGGTQDIFLYEEGKTIENCIQLVLPSPTVLVGEKITRCTEEGRDIFLSGFLMGGGASSKAIKKHIAEGLKVYALPEAAKTIRDDLEKVRELGVEIVNENPGAFEVRMGDICKRELETALNAFNVELPEFFAIAVQDHGESPPGFSNRRFRFNHWENFLHSEGRLANLLYNKPPEYFTRMWSVKKQIENVVFMDTGSAAIRGALCDRKVREWSQEGVLLINLGNQHTVGILLREDRVLGIFEHHTGLIWSDKLDNLIEKFVAGKLSNTEVFNDGGHGCVISEEYGKYNKFKNVVITGPQRHKTQGKGYYWASPFGNMMLTGAYGLVAALLEKRNKKLLDKVIYTT